MKKATAYLGFKSFFDVVSPSEVGSYVSNLYPRAEVNVSFGPIFTVMNRDPEPLFTTTLVSEIEDPDKVYALHIPLEDEVIAGGIKVYQIDDLVFPLVITGGLSDSLSGLRKHFSAFEREIRRSKEILRHWEFVQVKQKHPYATAVVLVTTLKEIVMDLKIQKASAASLRVLQEISDKNLYISRRF